MEQTEREKRKGLLLALAITAVLVTGYTALCAVPGPEIWPGVTVLDVPLGGLDRTEAKTALSRALAKTPPKEQGVVFRAENGAGESRVAAVSLSDVQVDVEETVDLAMTLGRGEPFPLRGGALLQCILAGSAVPPVCRPGDGMTKTLDRLEAELSRPVVQTRWKVNDAALTVTKGTRGMLLDRGALEKTILDRISREEVVPLTAGPQFEIELPAVPPGEPDWSLVLERVERPVQNAVFDPVHGTFQTDRPGVTFDPAAVEERFAAMDWGETGDIPLTVTPPETTLADLEPLLYGDVLGTCTTGIAGSAGRLNNVTLAAEYFDGAVLLPGETFSYNDTVGRRTADRGFLPAPVYVSGQTVQETGGGVCQGSSTLYLAALRANLAVVERHSHGYVPRYVPDGMDAAVYYGVKDLKLKNDTPFPVKLTAQVQDRALTVSVLGTRTDGVTVEMTSRTVRTAPFRTVYRIANDLGPGQTRTAVTPYTGRTVEVYRNLYRDGVLTETRLENTSVYRSRDRVIQVSPADRRKYGL